MLGPGRYSQWHSRFLRYLDTKSNGEYLRKCIFDGPYMPTNVLIAAVEAAENILPAPVHTKDRNCNHHSSNLLPHDQLQLPDKKAKRSPNQLLLNLSQFLRKTVIQNKLGGIRICKRTWHSLLLEYFKKLYKPTNNNLRTSSNSTNKTEDTTPRYNNDNQSRQFGNQRTVTVAGARETVGSPVVQKTGIQCFNCKGFGHYARECRKPKRVKDYAYHKEKMMMCKQAEQGVPLQAEQADWLEDTDEEIDEQELEAHYSYMAKIQEVSPAESSSTDTPLEQVQNHDENDVFANVRRHSEQPESINDTYVLEKDDSNVIPDSSNICTNDNQENKTILKQLKKANASLTQELKECKTNLDESSRALGEATSSRDSSLIALQTKQTELEKEKQPDLQENASNVFRKEREQYHEIQDLKAQMLDKNRVINELKKLILDNSSTSVSRPQLKSYPVKDKVVPNISPVKFTKKENVQHILFIVDLDARKHMTGNAQAFV
ncbi:integrase, catalytic region, zinc finger, CCHC-type containing protein [Tanacetum coccineum]